MNNTDQIISAIKSFAHAIMRGVNKSEMYDKINVWIFKIIFEESYHCFFIT